MLRLFVAVNLPEGALQACAQEALRVERALGPLARGVRFPHAQGLHFTLKFLGATPEEQVEPLRLALTAAAANLAPFRLVLEGLEAFPSRQRPRVIYLGVAEGAAPMTRLAAAVEEQTSPLGFPTEQRPFTAHLTLGRVKDVRHAPQIGARLAALSPRRVAQLEVREVALMSSQLHPGGSRYTELTRAPLKPEWPLPAPC